LHTQTSRRERGLCSSADTETAAEASGELMRLTETRRREGGGSKVRLLGGGSGAAQGGEVAEMGRRLGEQVQVAW
jgi:hypothetical protein